MPNDRDTGLEGVEVVVDLLPREPDAGRQGGGRGRRRQLGQDAAADWIERDDGPCRIVDDFEVFHGSIGAATRFVVKRAT